MNTQHLQYVIEIERTRSISQAAENLFIGQPNLSRILHEMESALGYRIFERTSKGVRPTERGAAFMQHAKSILREMDSIEALGPRHPVANRLRICIPRSAATLELAGRYISTLPADQPLDAVIRECHVRQALDMLVGGEVELGIIRFRQEFRDYYEEQTTSRGLTFRILDKYRYQLVMAKNHPLASKETINREDLNGFTEIAHSDVFRVSGEPEEKAKRKVYCVDRLAQMSLLSTIHGSYMWTSRMPQQTLDSWGLTQKRCRDNQTVYLNALVHSQQYSMSEIESGFVQFVMSKHQEG